MRVQTHFFLDKDRRGLLLAFGRALEESPAQ
jgi:hypothetical protein